MPVCCFPRPLSHQLRPAVESNVFIDSRISPALGCVLSTASNANTFLGGSRKKEIERAYDTRWANMSGRGETTMSVCVQDLRTASSKDQAEDSDPIKGRAVSCQSGSSRLGRHDLAGSLSTCWISSERLTRRVTDLPGPHITPVTDES